VQAHNLVGPVRLENKGIEVRALILLSVLQLDLVFSLEVFTRFITENQMDFGHVIAAKVTNKVDPKARRNEQQMF
jgi:hypothetical protein